ncbi:tetratricopeptide repeat protein [Jannaschia donghaensis]|uniref:Lipoprotein NlpI n=1 Tax=Jannaschia donghaensis TaxID=420998 RepID=A0A0M6YE33_9RHOB|nr:tetratricopeptide repeat protein [Jannaschia donghaensis]CTQ48602.1 lipoprotein NlpI [Jannaschia donghaensis]
MFRSLLLAATCLAPLPALSQGLAGPYLSARIAGFNNDYEAAGASYADLVEQGETTPQILENALIIYSVLGDFDSAVDVADILTQDGQPSQFAASARMVVALRDGDLATARDLLDDGGIAGPLLDGLLDGWILAEEGDIEGALAAFDALADQEAFTPFGLRHKAYLLAMTGDMEQADEIMSGRSGDGLLNATARGIAAHGQVMAQLGRRDDALELVTKANDATSSALLRDMQARLQGDDDVPFDLIRTPQDGMAEAYFIFAALLAGDSSATFTLLNARAASALRPDHVEALVLIAQLLEQQDQLDLAAMVLDAVPSEDPAFYEAEIARADILLATNDDDAAVQALRSLTDSDGDKVEVWAALADALRRLDRFDESASAYDRAIEMLAEVTERNWLLFYARGIARERLDDWPGAERDFRRALELNPGNPNVLNYLGYGLVEQRIKLDEALDMIEQAVEARPNDGFIADSLAWVLYRLGRYEEAVEPMERAVMLTPLDPLINDHLGDVLWAVDRKREARFQWRRALSLDPQEQEDRIRRKLEVGLDVVLEEEGGVGPIEAVD